MCCRLRSHSPITSKPKASRASMVKPKISFAVGSPYSMRTNRWLEPSLTLPGARIVRFGGESDASASDVGQAEAAPDIEPVIEPRPAPSPVRETIERIARKLDENRQDAVEAAIKPAAKLVAKAASSGNRRAAFTLRLDPERHLRLRLASTISGSSAQVLVTQALDAMLARMPEIETLATQVKRQ